VSDLLAERRRYHRNAVSQTMIRLRHEKSWTQEDLAGRLAVDRRQVVRLETGDAPVTLEVVDMLAETFGVAAHDFMWSLPGSGGQDPAGILGADLAREELQRRWVGRLDRPAMRRIALLSAMLDEDDLQLLVAVAAALEKAASASAAGVPDRSFLMRPIRHAKVTRSGAVRSRHDPDSKHREPIEAKNRARTSRT
jgi:transcriptional regulator with XRE-family HTH domain